jgi:nitrite reductase/ring-hydroxylating ferredoxin subunit
MEVGWLEVANNKDIEKNKMKLIGSQGKKYVVANMNGKFYTFNDRCPYMNAPLHLGVLKGKIIECPLCHAKYDVTSGKKLSDPKMDMPEDISERAKMFRKMNEIMSHIETLDLQRYETKNKAGKISVKFAPSEMFKPPSPMVHPPPDELAEMFKPKLPKCHTPSHEHSEKIKPESPKRQSPAQSDFSVSRKPTVKLTVKYCWNCGNTVLEKARFCDNCGSQVYIPKLTSSVT